VQSMASAPRRRLGKYELCARLGSGGQAEVFLALMRGQAGFNKLVVIKKLLAGVGVEAPIRVSRFLDEARLAARLNHPNIVDTYEIGEDGGDYFIAMEYLEGQPMSAVAQSPVAWKSFTPAMWARVASEALAGLGYAHELADYDGTPLGIVHRDISPDNMFLTYNGEVKLVDFGVAKARLNQEQTEAGFVKGKISYMAPEQVRGNPDHRADLFSMGVVLWVILTGRRLFDGDPASVLYQLMTDPIPGLATARPGVDPWLAAIVDRALQKNPALRFQTAEQMREELEGFIRASGDSVSGARRGEVVREAFAGTRQRVQRQVQEALSREAPSDACEVAAELPPQAALPEIAAATPSQRLTGTLPALALAPSARAPAKPRRRLGLLMLGAAAVGITIAIVTGPSTGKPPVVIAPPPARLAPVERAGDPPSHSILASKPEAPTPQVAVPKAGDDSSDHDAPKAAEATTPKEAPAAPVLSPRPAPQRPAPQRASPPRGSPPRGPTPRYGRAIAPSPEPGETAAPAPVITSPQVKVIEDEPKQKIKVIND
jgi:phosphate transport system substrate-binding protein